MKHEESKKFVETASRLIDDMIPCYIREGKYHLNLAFGCTGGHHRSVTIANWLYGLYKDRYQCFLSHRDSKV